MPEPLVSVIIPTFNRAYCVGRAIDSVRTQTHQNTEILVLDDGSTDGTRDLIERSYADDPRVRYFFHENRGVTATRNRGIISVPGRLRGPARLRRHVVALEARAPARVLSEPCPEIGMVWSDMEAIGPDGDVVSPILPPDDVPALTDGFRARSSCSRNRSRSAEIAPRLASVVGDRRLYTGEIFSQMIMGNLVHTSTVLIRRERLEKVRGFNEEFRYFR